MASETVRATSRRRALEERAERRVGARGRAAALDLTDDTDTDTGSGDTGSGPTGSGDTGSGPTGSGDTGSGPTGSGDTGSGPTGSGDQRVETVRDRRRAVTLDESAPPLGAGTVGGPRSGELANVGERVAATVATLRSGSLSSLGRRPRIGGVAPFVAPERRLARNLLLRRWERRGFVPLSRGRPKLRHRILPRSVIGIASMLLAFGVGAAFSGASFYAYYDKRLAENEETVARFVEGFDQQFTDATGRLDELRVDAIDDIRAELAPLGDYVDDANGVIGLPQIAGPSVWHLQTRDEAGEAVGGAAFAVAVHGEGTAFVTSYSLVVSSVTAPNPPIELVKDDDRLTARLWTWDEEHDVAVVVVDDVAVPPLELATVDEQVSSVGSRAFALSGVGGQGSTASPGVLLDRSELGVQHTAGVGSLFVGGPILTGAGKVVAVATLGYRPDGIDPGQVLWAPDVTALCETVLNCAEDQVDRLTVDVAGDEPEGASFEN